MSEIPDDLEQWCDYEYLGHCQYGVPDRSIPEGVGDCQEPAIARMWWGTKGGEMLVCQEHLDFILKTEKEEIERQREEQ